LPYLADPLAAATFLAGVLATFHDLRDFPGTSQQRLTAYWPKVQLELQIIDLISFKR